MSLTLVAIASAAFAEDKVGSEDGFLDVRIGYTIADTEYERRDNISDETVEEDWDNVHRPWVLLMYSPGLDPHGWLFGVDVTADFRDVNSEDDDVDVEYEAYSAHLHVGYGVVLGNHFQLEFVPFFGAGIAKIEGVDAEDEPTVLEYGANVNGIVLFDRFMIGAQIGYLLSDTDEEFRDNVDTTEDQTYDWQSGSLTFSGFLGIRF
ncbi:MAG TPA: hypothetical protein VEL07_15055 [Planctomycetota bacterium]|nr:hypothetical protein [Planctomycetota bacterium]